MKQKQHKIEWSGWVLIGIVICSVILVVIALVAALMQRTPEQKAQAEMKHLADDYYVTYLYPRLLGDLSADPSEKLSEYVDTGTPVTLLRQLLNYGDGSQASKSEAYFVEVGCDTNTTGVRYFPVEPFGPEDYEIRYTWYCQNGDFPTE